MYHLMEPTKRYVLITKKREKGHIYQKGGHCLFMKMVTCKVFHNTVWHVDPGPHPTAPPHPPEYPPLLAKLAILAYPKCSFTIESIYPLDLQKGIFLTYPGTIYSNLPCNYVQNVYNFFLFLN